MSDGCIAPQIYKFYLCTTCIIIKIVKQDIISFAYSYFILRSISIKLLEYVLAIWQHSNIQKVPIIYCI